MTLVVTVNGARHERAVEPRLLLSDFLRLSDGSGGGDALHPLQAAFREAHGLQCGFCTPGVLMTLVPFLREHPDPDERQIREALSGNLCRCTGYQNIVAAVRLACGAPPSARA